MQVIIKLHNSTCFCQLSGLVTLN